MWTKVRGTTWNDGTAVSYPLRIGELVRLDLPAAITESLLVSNLATYATLALELGLAVLVWNRRARPWVLVAGVAFHLAIEVTMRVGFSLTMFVYYLAWLHSRKRPHGVAGPAPKPAALTRRGYRSLTEEGRHQGSIGRPSWTSGTG